MALVKYGGGIIQASGSIAGNTYARNRFGNYIRPRTKPVNPNSAGQVLIRSALSFYAARWHDTLDAAQRIAWGTYAAAIAMKNRLGETVYLTGFNHFIRSNVVREQLNYAKCDDGPLELTLPEKDPTFAVAAYVTPQQLSITWDDTLPWKLIAASAMGLWMGQPQAVTRNFFGGPWRLTGAIDAGSPTPYLGAPSFTLVLGQKIWVYGRISTGPTDCRLSEPFYASCTVEATPPV